MEASQSNLKNEPFVGRHYESTSAASDATEPPAEKFEYQAEVEVSTKSPKSDKQYVWEGEANSSSYTIQEETDPAKLIPRGSRLTLYQFILRLHDDKGFAHPERIQKLVKNYSLFVSFPIYTWQEKGFAKEIEVDEDPAEANKDAEERQTEKKKKTKKVVERYWDWELTNKTQPIWLRNPKEVTTEEYNEFYEKTFNEYLEPLASSHFTTEGEVEFRSVLYVPSMAPTGKDDIVNPKTKNIRLYVKRVFISDNFDGELFPRYLSFIKGVVDSNYLPLNVSREILQESRIVCIMRKRLVLKAFDMILGITMSDDRDDYVKFWENFGKHLKLGCIEDRENHKRVAPLLRFFSSQSEEDMISLDEYVENMKPDQKDIYFIVADSVASARNTPFLEKLVEKNTEVLFLVDPIDEVAIQNLKAYKEKNFVDISKDDLDLAQPQHDNDPAPPNPDEYATAQDAVFDSSHFADLNLNPDCGDDGEKQMWDEKYRNRVKSNVFGEDVSHSRILEREEEKKRKTGNLARALLEAALDEDDNEDAEEREVTEEDQKSLSVGIIGAPNAGKSALTNCMVCLPFLHFLF
ncbi:HEAT SHOCK PROTEIN 89.1 [Striga hermonthica]|uniref:HEAT SHOCK PROTEIN 89.1 n=1 Tax=Striga hermonthica TaxID=68872 RepID=A0A9N7P248_STRHE|nr:HEAT SHOCK PROTEIN 89.1 [Striga hermonthica]